MKEGASFDIRSARLPWHIRINNTGRLFVRPVWKIGLRLYLYCCCMDTKGVETWHTYLCHYLPHSNTHTHTPTRNIYFMSEYDVVQGPVWNLHSRQLRPCVENRTQQRANWRDFSAVALCAAVIIISIGNTGRARTAKPSIHSEDNEMYLLDFGWVNAKCHFVHMHSQMEFALRTNILRVHWIAAAMQNA